MRLQPPRLSGRDRQLPGPVSRRPDGPFNTADVDDAPPVLRAVGRFITAALNGDTPTVQAVWTTFLTDAEPADVGPFIHSVVRAAIDAAEQRLTLTTNGS